MEKFNRKLQSLCNIKRRNLSEKKDGQLSPTAQGSSLWNSFVCGAAIRTAPVLVALLFAISTIFVSAAIFSSSVFGALRCCSQVGPIDFGVQLFAQNSTVKQALNVWAVFSRNLSALTPLEYNPLRCFERICKGCQAAG